MSDISEQQPVNQPLSPEQKIKILFVQRKRQQKQIEIGEAQLALTKIDAELQQVVNTIIVANGIDGKQVMLDSDLNIIPLPKQ